MSQSPSKPSLAKAGATLSAKREQIFFENNASKKNYEVRDIGKKDNVSVLTVVLPLVAVAAMFYAVVNF